MAGRREQRPWPTEAVAEASVVGARARRSRRRGGQIANCCAAAPRSRRPGAVHPGVTAAIGDPGRAVTVEGVRRGEARDVPRTGAAAGSGACTGRRPWRGRGGSEGRRRPGAAAARGGLVQGDAVDPQRSAATTGGRCLTAHLNGGTRPEGRRADPSDQDGVRGPASVQRPLPRRGLAGVPNSPVMTGKPSSRGLHNGSVPTDVPGRHGGDGRGQGGQGTGCGGSRCGRGSDHDSRGYCYYY